MIRILVTGGNGFIAKSIKEALNDKYTIIALNRQSLDLLNTESVFSYISSNKFDVVIHSATYDAAPSFSTKDPNKVLENNLKMFFNIARCNKLFGKMIYFGSGAEFGRKHFIPKMKEDYFDVNVPSDQYGFSKYIMAKYAQVSNNIYNLRLFSLFGKYDDWRYRLIPNACCQAVLGLPITINQNRIFDFTYIDDFITIIDWFINNSPSQKIYNICSGEPYEFLDIAKIINEVTNKNLEIRFKKPGMGVEYSGDNSLLKSELKDLSFTPIKKSIQYLISYYEQNSNLLEKKYLE